jgi:hypothetical protein
MEIWEKNIQIYNSTTLSLSKAPSNSSNFSSKLRSLSIKCAKHRRGFTTYPRMIGPIFAHKNQFIQIF